MARTARSRWVYLPRFTQILPIKVRMGGLVLSVGGYLIYLISDEIIIKVSSLSHRVVLDYALPIPISYDKSVLCSHSLLK